MKEEYDALINNNTWTLTQLPIGRKAIGSKWVFKLKQNSDGSIARFKARLVAKGYTQKEGIDFNETYAPVAKITTIRSMLALAAMRGYNVNQMDISTAYLHADVKEDLYMEQPEGYQLTGSNGEKLVCKLNKSIYGLKQAGRNWNKTLDNWLQEHQLVQSKVDPCLYLKQSDSQNEFLAMAIYVDDLFSIDNNHEFRKDLATKMSKKFKLTDIGKANWILGTKVVCQDLQIHINQEKYVSDVLERFRMQECKVVNTPVVAGGSNIEADSKQYENKTEYMSLVGSLIYLSVISRPDIAYAVSKAGQKMSNPSETDWIAAKRILRYLKGDNKSGPTYSINGSEELLGFVDSDWAGDINSRKSTSGYVFILGGAAISWSSKRQQTVALSSTEAEYMAASSAAQEAIYLRALLKDLGCVQERPTKILQDNQGAIAMAKDVISSRRTKHIDIRYHFIRERIRNGDIHLEYEPTETMLADCLTKPVSKQVMDRAKAIFFGSEV
jgi:hypothetical protein